MERKGVWMEQAAARQDILLDPSALRFGHQTCILLTLLRYGEEVFRIRQIFTDAEK